jgi:hypothetical protein
MAARGWSASNIFLPGDSRFHLAFHSSPGLSTLILSPLPAHLIDLLCVLFFFTTARYVGVGRLLGEEIVEAADGSLEPRSTGTFVTNCAHIIHTHTLRSHSRNRHIVIPR